MEDVRAIQGIDADAPVTDELLERLLKSLTPEEYLVDANLDERSLSEYLTHLREEKGLTRAQVIRASGVGVTFAYQVFSGERMPGRDNAIMLSFGLGATLRETQRLLRHAGVSELWSRNRRDAIIIYCIKQGLSREKCDDELYRMGEATLFPREG